MKNENNPGIRLIDANALLRQDDPTYDDEGFRVWYATDINRAPTITPTFQLKDITDEDVARFAMIWQRATSKGLILEPEKAEKQIEEQLSIRAQSHWKIDGPLIACNICGRILLKASELYNYCPNCGARMHGGVICQEK